MGEKKFARIESLKCFKEVYDRLVCGYPLSAVTRFIQNEKAECQDVPYDTLYGQLKRYRKRILPEDILSRRQPHIFVEAHKRYADKLEELRRLDVQYEGLMYRFDLTHAEERISGVINPQVDKINKSIVDTIRSMHNIKMDLGINGQRNLGSVYISEERLAEIREKHGDKAAKAMADPVSRARVLGALDLIRKEAWLKTQEEREAAKQNREKSPASKLQSLKTT